MLGGPETPKRAEFGWFPRCKTGRCKSTNPQSSVTGAVPMLEPEACKSHVKMSMLACSAPTRTPVSSAPLGVNWLASRPLPSRCPPWAALLLGLVRLSCGFLVTTSSCRAAGPPQRTWRSRRTKSPGHTERGAQLCRPTRWACRPEFAESQHGSFRRQKPPGSQIPGPSVAQGHTRQVPPSPESKENKIGLRTSRCGDGGSSLSCVFDSRGHRQCKLGPLRGDAADQRMGPGSQGAAGGCEEKGEGGHAGAAALSDMHNPSLRDLSQRRKASSSASRGPGPRKSSRLHLHLAGALCAQKPGSWLLGWRMPLCHDTVRRQRSP